MGGKPVTSSPPKQSVRAGGGRSLAAPNNRGRNLEEAPAAAFEPGLLLEVDHAGRLVRVGHTSPEEVRPRRHLDASSTQTKSALEPRVVVFAGDRVVPRAQEEEE